MLREKWQLQLVKLPHKYENMSHKLRFLSYFDASEASKGERSEGESAEGLEGAVAPAPAESSVFQKMFSIFHLFWTLREFFGPSDYVK